jgi:bifunctional non-homologous end joining protein LigD
VLSHDEVRAFSRGFVDRLASHDPSSFTAKMAKEARSGRVFIDYLRNAHGATAVCAFSTRARPGAPVSVPVTWDELGDIDDPGAFDTATVAERIAKLAADPWEGYDAARTEITGAHFAAMGVPFQEHLGDEG